MQSGSEPSPVPVLTLFFSIIMGAIVAGVAEESAFRGYMQGPLERRHGPVVAILTVGVLFGFAHFSHPEVGFAMMPYYIIVATVYGMLAYFTNSILPSLVLHAGGNMLSSLGLFMGGVERGGVGHGAPEKPLLIWETGLDPAFWVSCGAMLVVGTLGVLAYRRLARVAGERQADAS